MSRLPYDKMRVEYDDDCQCHYVIWQYLTAIGMGRTGREALEDLWAAAHFGIGTMVNLKLGEIGTGLLTREVKSDEQNGTDRRSNLGHR